MRAANRLGTTHLLAASAPRPARRRSSETWGKSRHIVRNHPVMLGVRFDIAAALRAGAVGLAFGLLLWAATAEAQMGGMGGGMGGMGGGMGGGGTGGAPAMSAPPPPKAT